MLASLKQGNQPTKVRPWSCDSLGKEGSSSKASGSSEEGDGNGVNGSKYCGFSGRCQGVVIFCAILGKGLDFLRL
jgi:hypothetical protein